MTEAAAGWRGENSSGNLLRKQENISRARDEMIVSNNKSILIETSHITVHPNYQMVEHSCIQSTIIKRHTLSTTVYSLPSSNGTH